LAVTTREQWEALAMLVQQPGWATRADLQSIAGRRDQHDVIDDHLRAFFATINLDDAVEMLQGVGVPAAPVMGAGHIDRDEHLRERGFFQWVEHPVMGAHEFPGLPMRPVQGAPQWFSRPAPLLGQHTAEVLRERLGLTADEIAALESDAVIGTVPRGLG
jgi:crotonobetainyl-CoA:carnitine CoA-transferase CaiB-like acyl-CoA transferase